MGKSVYDIIQERKKKMFEISTFNRSTFLTNFNAKFLPAYRKAVDEYGDKDIFLCKAPSMHWNFESNAHSLHIKKRRKCLEFWELFENIRHKMGLLYLFEE